MAVVIAAIAVLLALLFVASRAVARSPGFVAGWMRGASFTPPPPPPGMQEDDDFRWRWRQAGRTGTPEVPVLVEQTLEGSEDRPPAEPLRGRVQRGSGERD